MKRIFISQSGQENNRYANGYTEEQGMSIVTNNIAETLVSNYEVEVVRNNPAQGLNDYPAQANRSGCTAYYSFHSNAGGGTGAEVIVAAGANKSSATKDRSNHMGLAMLNCLVNSLGRKSRGIKTRLNSANNDYFAEIRMPNMPSIITEIEFHDSIAGANWIVQNAKEIGTKLGHAIAAFEELPKKNVAPVTPQPPAQTRKFKVGDKVIVSGALYADSFGTKVGKTVVRLETTIGIVATNSRAPKPYNIGNKMGWVSEDSIQKITPTTGVLRVGSRVKIKASAARYATGQVIPKPIKSRVFTIKQVGTGKYADRVLLGEILSWVMRADVELV